MIYYVSGPVTVLEPGLAVVDCGGVGYGCRVTAYTASALKLNQPAKLYVTESIREDAHDLYGFISREEQRCYELLTSVTGVVHIDMGFSFHTTKYFIHKEYI